MTNHRLVRRAIFGVLGGTVAVGAFLFPSERAGAGFLEPYSLAPSSGPPSTVVTVHGTDCSPGLVVDAQDYVLISATTLLLAAVRVPVAADGSWTGTFTVPADAPPLTAAVAAACFSDGLPSLLTTYTPRVFTVTAPPGPPAPTTSPPAGAVPGGVGSPPTTAGSTTPSTSPPTAGGGTPGPSNPGSGTPSAGTEPGKGPPASDPAVSAAEPLLDEALAREARSAGLQTPELSHAPRRQAPGLAWLNWALLGVLAGSIAGLGAWLRWTRVQLNNLDPPSDA